MTKIRKKNVKTVVKKFTKKFQIVVAPGKKFSINIINDYWFNKKKENRFHTNFIFRVDQRDGSSRVRVEGWEHE
jgi:hypothetical protein